MGKFQNILIKEQTNVLNAGIITDRNKLKAMSGMMYCHTKEMGMNYCTCSECNYKSEVHYNSCGNRHCVDCQQNKTEEWVDNYRGNLLDTLEYFHMVFTVPDSLNPLFYSNQKDMYNLLFRAASAALTEAAAKEYGKIGFTFILHTWGSNLAYHPHIHAIVAGGGITTDDEGNEIFKKAPRNYLLPVRAVSALFRGKMISGINKMRSKLKFSESCRSLEVPSEFDAFMKEQNEKKWVVYSKSTFSNSEAVLNYIGRYTHRIAISNSRILDYDEENHKVTFSYKNYRKDGQKSEMTLSATEFFRRFFMHVLPNRFMKIRHYGFMGNRVRKELIKKCRELLRIPASERPTGPAQKSSETPDWCICPKCGKSLIYHNTRPLKPHSSG